MGHRPDRRHECCGWIRRVVCRSTLLRRRSAVVGRRPRVRRFEGRRTRGHERVRLRRQHLRFTRRASRCARAERQHRRRSARLELVHQPDRPSGDDSRRRGQRPRSTQRNLTRRLGCLWRQRLRDPARLPNDGSGGPPVSDRSGPAVESRAGERRRDHRDRFLSRHRVQHGRCLPR